MNMHFTLTSKSGIYASGNPTTTIGQSEGCDIRIPNATKYADVIMAKIAANSDNSGWHIVRISPYYPIIVNGVEIKRVHYLDDGDNIEMGGTHFRFNIRQGELQSPSVTHLHQGGRLLWAIMLAIVAIAAAIGYMFYDSGRENITPQMRRDITASIFTTRVDSLKLICGDSIIDSYYYASSPIGSAFLTTNSLIVTARHCIQPWLNMVKPEDYGKLSSMTDWPIQAALFAETQNQLNGTDDYKIVSYLTLTDEDGETMSFSSQDFKINDDFDEIIELGDYNNPLYWRSISHRYAREDMMLGDVASVKTDRIGKIPLASETDIRSLLRPGVRLTFVGHPEASVGGNAIDFKTDELHAPLRETAGLPGRLFVLAHDGALIKGFSGGPVLVRDGIGFKAVGVISVADSRNHNRSYSVPTSEI